MASGCIIGTCPVCGEIIWEDEWDIVGDAIIHESCRKDYFKATYHISEQQFQRLFGAEELRKEIAEVKAQLEEDERLLKEGYERRIEDLENRLKELKIPMFHVKQQEMSQKNEQIRKKDKPEPPAGIRSGR